MKLTAQQSDLAAAAAAVAKLCPASPVVPAMATVVITATADGLTLTAADFDQTITARIGAHVAEPGTTAVSGRLLAAVTKSAPRAELTLVDDGGRLTVQAPSGRWVMPTMPTDLILAPPAIDGQLGTVDSAALATALARSIAAAAGPTTTVTDLAAVYVHAGRHLVLVGCDAYRLAVSEVPWTPAGDGERELFIPLSGATMLGDLARSAGEVVLGTADHMLAASTSTATMLTRLNTQYPPWQRLDQPIASYELTVGLDVASLRAAVAGIRTVLVPDQPIRVRIRPDEVELAAVGDTPAEQRVPASTTVEDHEFGIDPARLDDALRTIGTPQMLLHLPASATSQMLLTPATGTEIEPGHRHMLMPVRLRPVSP